MIISDVHSKKLGIIDLCYGGIVHVWWGMVRPCPPEVCSNVLNIQTWEARTLLLVCGLSDTKSRIQLRREVLKYSREISSISYYGVIVIEG